MTAHEHGERAAPEPVVLVLMGVSGSGKTTVARRLAERLGWDCQEGDDLHPPGNVAKMASGRPLTDDDREPWLASVAQWIAEHTDRPGVITCSALKRSYRDVLRGPHVVFVLLAGTREQLLARLAARPAHFMPASLLDSQLADLEPPEPDERSVTLDISAEPSDLVDQLVAVLRLNPRGAS